MYWIGCLGNNCVIFKHTSLYLFPNLLPPHIKPPFNRSFRQFKFLRNLLNRKLINIIINQNIPIFAGKLMKSLKYILIPV